MLEIAVVQALVSSLLAVFPQIPAGISQFINSLISQLPALVASGTDIIAFVKMQMTGIGSMIAENRDPTQAEWDALNASLAGELSKLDAAAGVASTA